jgi:choice-of-anchor B domain-containing protein
MLHRLTIAQPPPYIDTHQGWVTNPNWQEFLVLDDEYDEYDGAGPAASGYPITYFWDIRSLENPKQTGVFRSQAYGIDHNQFVIDGFAYQSNYGSGLRILDISSLPRDPTGSRVKEVGFFDIYPEDDNLPNGGVVDFVGTWSHYPFFKSGYILVNTIERGAFVLKRSRR